ncbi:MAG: NUDIX domain-containing protein [Coriobacteriia bacterium]|nr:NUDIX domain-containing protein [Coriobacteriia bacterium]
MDDREFLATYDSTQFERLSVAVDVVLLSVFDGVLRVLVVERDEPPQQGKWALPGTFVRTDESLDEAARRALATKAQISNVFVEQLYTFGAPERDPRTRVISVTHYALVAPERLGDADLRRVRVPWEGEAGGPVEVVDSQGSRLPLAFDHAEILGMAVKRLRGKLDYSPIGFQLLPERFTLRRLQDVHETILGRPLNKDSFRRRMLASDQLEATGEREDDVEHRPAELYRFIHLSAV